jgi:radical SAM superfamily enzyme YgiQ (UPF0313 family)
MVGGPHATVEPESTLALPGVDAVAVGEAEHTVAELVRRDLQPEGVPGLWHRAEGQTIAGSPPELVRDLDTLPFPAWDLLDMPRYVSLWYHLDAVRYGLRGTSIMASRGCPFRCAYCQPTLRTIFGTRIRCRSAGNLIGEMIELRERFAIDGLMWLDDTFLVNREWMHDFCAKVVAAKLGLIWGANIRADLAEAETLATMREAGLRVVHVGIESASQRILDEVYQKRITLEQVRETVDTARRLGLHVRGYFMLGAPTETLEEAEATLRLANTLDLDDVTFSITTPLPHTYLYDFSREDIAADFSDFDYYKRAVYAGDRVLPAPVLNRLRRSGYLRFYLGPRRFARTVRSALGLSGLRKMLLKLQRF